MKAGLRRAAWAWFVTWCLHMSPATAQVLNFDTLRPGDNRLTVTTGIDPAILGAVAYTRTAALGGRPVAFSVEIALPLAGLDVRDYRGILGAQTSALQWGRWHVAGGAGIVAHGTRNDIHDAHSLGADLTAYTGYYGARRFVALELGFEKTVATYIVHRAWYRDYFYEGAVDGWYSSTGGTWHTGLQAGIDIGRVELALHASLHRSEAGNALSPPINGTLSCTYPF